MSPARPSQTTVAPAAWRTKLEELFGVDRRSLAAFRVALAGMLFVDLILRAAQLQVFYTDQGWLPRQLHLEQWPSQWRDSLYLLGGSTAYVASLFVISGLCYLALLVGYRTRLATILACVLHFSLLARNPYILIVGDWALHIMLFWCMFVPLGAYWSVDHAMDTSGKRTPQRILNVGTAAVVLQLAMLLVLSALQKRHPIWHTEFTAIYYAFQIDSFLSPFGAWVRQYFGVLQVLTGATLIVEGILPIVAFSPVFTGPLRTLAALSVMAVFAGIAACLHINIIPYAMIVVCVVWLPGWFWDRIAPARLGDDGAGIRIYYDGDCTFCYRMGLLVRTFLALPEAMLLPAQSEQARASRMAQEYSWIVVDADGAEAIKFDAFVLLCRRSRLGRWVAPLLGTGRVRWCGTRVYERVAHNRMRLGRWTAWLHPHVARMAPRFLRASASALCAVLFVYAFFWGIAALGPAYAHRFMLPQLEWIAPRLGIQQAWTMFAPAPRQEDGWPVMAATLADGRQVDLFRGGAPLTWEKPEAVANLFPNYRTVLFVRSLVDYQDVPGQPNWVRYADSLVGPWNATHGPDQQVATFTAYWMRELAPLPGFPQEPATPVQIFSYAPTGPTG